MRLIKVLTLCAFVTCFIVLQSCKQSKVKSNKKEPELYAFRMVRGGPDTVRLDNKTSLAVLIKRFEGPWDWAQTGAGYWIGYTDDMFSIASHKDEAINPLVSFISNTDSLHAKIGGIFTLHLIGINSYVAGRQYEEFKDTLARKALLSFLTVPKLSEWVIYLLRRDPWAYDIQYFINYLSIPNQDYSIILDAMRRYQPFYDFLPLWQPLPENILSKEIDIYTNINRTNQAICEMIALKNTFKGRVIIDEDILKSKEWKEGLECYRRKTYHQLDPWIYPNGDTIYKKPTINEIESFFYHPFADYGPSHQDKFIYAYRNDSLFIYSPETARKLILSFWGSLSNDQIQQIIKKKK